MNNNWRKVKLEEITTLITKGTTPTTYGYNFVEEGINFLKIENLNNDNNLLKITPECHEKLKRSQLEENDILFSIAGSLGNTYIVKKDILPCNTNQALAIIRLEDNVDKNYINYFLNGPTITKVINGLKTVGAQPNLSLKQVGGFNIDLPSLKEQQKIAEILSSVDAAIEKTEQVIAKTEEVKKGLMQQLLTKGIGHTEFKQTELGEIPVEWEVKKIKEICEVVSGGTPKTSVAQYWDSEDVVWITPTDITSHAGKYIADSSRKISKKGLEESSANLLPIGSVLMCSRATIGPRAINTVPVSTNQGFKSFICSSAINNQFLYYLIDVLKEFFIKNASGSTFLEVSKSTVENCLIALPSIDEQMRIVDILSNIDYKSTNEQEKLLKLNYMKQGLMQQLLTGQVRVKID